MSNDNVRELRPGSSDTTHQVADEPKGRSFACASFTCTEYNNSSLTFAFDVTLEPSPGVIEKRKTVIGFNDGLHILESLLPMQDCRMPVALHYNPVVDATKPDGSAYALHELPTQEYPAGLYLNTGTYVPLLNPQL